MAVSAQDNRVLTNEDDLSYIHGVLKVEIKEASKIYELARKERLYVAVVVGGMVKRTQSVTRTYGQASWAQTKHFPLRVDLNKKHKDNLVCVELVCCNAHPEDSQADRVVGMVAFHLHDVIKQSPVDGVFDLFNSYQTVGEIKLSLAFAYGLFGYGYSAQLFEEKYDVAHFVADSLFPRITIEPSRLDSSKQVLIPKATRHPQFIPFNQRIHLGFGQEISTTLDNLQDTNGKFSLLGNNMRRLGALQEQLKRETSRTNRLDFLSGLLLDNDKKSETIKEKLDEASFEHDISQLIPSGNATLKTLSHEEMKERGLLVASLPKDQDKEKQPIPAVDTDNVTLSTSNIATTTANKGPRSASFRSSDPPPVLPNHAASPQPIMPPAPKLSDTTLTNPNIQRVKLNL